MGKKKDKEAESTNTTANTEQESSDKKGVFKSAMSKATNTVAKGVVKAIKPVAKLAVLGAGALAVERVGEGFVEEKARHETPVIDAISVSRYEQAKAEFSVDEPSTMEFTDETQEGV